MKRVFIQIQNIIPLETLKKGYFPAGTSSYTMLDHEHLEFITVDKDLLVIKVREDIVR